MVERAIPEVSPVLEARLPCPVCLVAMEKATLHGAAGALALDHCTRCGGVWFGPGEVQQLASRAPAELWAQIAPRRDAVRPPCHGCGTPLDRDLPRCPACHRANDLACPTCDELMTRRPHQGIALDVCQRCRGIWFDHHELAALWRLNLAEAARRHSRGTDTLAVGGDVLMDAMIWTPGLVLHGAAGAAQVGGAAIEVVGTAAEGVFGAVLDIISSLFE
ncbi:MAG: zf-TFIIB domain-containing protein [Gemmatimonadota bacterium]